ncbi:MAG TPA: acylphosphatase, partial [Alphaproteobacteria bacterium]|nr:acylphosphatase [Alphaproteobacteria bacterium]
MAAQAGGLVGGQGGTRIAVRCVVTGKVQGVWYRGWTVEQATAAGLDGWVRNRMDGSVEAVFAGRQMVVEAMVENCRHGPPAAQVTDV